MCLKKCPRCGQSMRCPPPMLPTIPLLAPSITTITVFIELRASAVTHPAVFLQTHTGAKYQCADLTCKPKFKCSVCGVVPLPRLLWATNILLQSRFRGTFHRTFSLWLGSCCSPVNTHTDTQRQTHTHARHMHAEIKNRAMAFDIIYTGSRQSTRCAFLATKNLLKTVQLFLSQRALAFPSSRGRTKLHILCLNELFLFIDKTIYHQTELLWHADKNYWNYV